MNFPIFKNIKYYISTSILQKWKITLFLVLFFNSFSSFAMINMNDLKFYNRIIQNNKEVKDTSQLKNNFNSLFKQKYDQKIINIIYLLLYARIYATEKDDINNKSTSLFNEAIKLAENSKNEDLILLTNTYTGFYYYSYSDIVKAYPYFYKSAHLLDNKEQYVFINSSDILKKNAYFLSFIGENKKSLKYLKLALKNTEKNTKEYSNILNGIAQYYIQFKEYEKAKNYLNKTLSYSKNINKIRYAKALGDLALIYKEQKEYNKAIAFLLKDIEISNSIKEYRNILYAKILLSKIYFDIKEFDLVLRTINEAEFLTTNKPYLNSFALEINKIRLELSLIQKNQNDELKYRRKLSLLEKELSNKDGENVITKINLQLQKDNIQHQLETEKIKKEKETFKNNALLIIVFLFFICIVLMYLYFKNHLKQQKQDYNNKILNLNLQKIKSEKILLEKTNSLETQKAYLLDKDLQINNLITEISNIKESKISYLEEQNGELKSLLQSHLMTNENWNNFKAIFIKEQNEYYNFLMNKFPNLTESNLRIIFLLKLGLNNTQTAHLLGVTVEAVKKSKQRLKKKYCDDYYLIIPNKKAQL